MITKADYDELVWLRDAGCTVVTKQIYWIVLGEGKGFCLSATIGANLIPNRSRKLNIAAAIAEYERAQEGK
jgi:hypothetical protein